VEVHPPSKPIHSIKDFMVHLLAITIGLLIALGLEAAVEAVHHRSLVREARHNIAKKSTTISRISRKKCRHCRARKINWKNFSR
jgi:hypothetical protein